MKYKVKGNEVVEFTNALEKLINDEISPKISEMDKLAKRALWTGPARNSFVNRYDEVMHELKKMPELLFLYTDFLGKVVTNYDEAFVEFQKKFKQLEEELDERSIKDELSSII